MEKTPVLNFVVLSKQSLSIEKCKREFLNIHSVAKHQKIEGGPLETKTICEKSRTKPK